MCLYCRISSLFDKDNCFNLNTLLGQIAINFLLASLLFSCSFFGDLFFCLVLTINIQIITLVEVYHDFIYVM